MLKTYWKIQAILESKDGFGTIELILLICVLIGLALMFKDTIVDFVSGILDNISNQGGVFDPGAIVG